MAGTELLIPASALDDHFQCTICFEPLSSTLITGCGHRFCSKCILECLSRKPCCPCCNQPLSKAGLIRDHQFDSLAEAFRVERDRAERAYFSGLIQRSEQQQRQRGADGAAGPRMVCGDDGHGKHGDAVPCGQGPVLSPIEALFQQHLGESLALHERAMQEFQRRFERSKAAVLGQPQQLARLEDELQHSQGVLLQAYRQYLEESMPRPRMLPVPVTITVPAKGYRGRNFRLQPDHSGATLKDMLLARMEAEGLEPIRVTGKGFRLLHELSEASRDAGPAVVMDATLPQLEFGVLPNAVFELDGTVVCQADLPASCFADEFAAKSSAAGGGPVAVDYYACADCNLSWICPSCAKKCHASHAIKPFLRGHRTTWGCCYCRQKQCDSCRLAVPPSLT